MMVLEEAVGNDPNICMRCAEMGPTCCRLEPGREEFCFPLSEMERDRILDFSGEKGSFVQEQNTKPFQNNLKRLFPAEEDLIEKLFPIRENKFHLRLATDKKGKCVFLRSQGCALPRSARPYYCRLFPFWIQGNKSTMFTSVRCLAVKEGGNLRGVHALMSLNDAEVRRLHGKMRLAWGLPPQRGMELLTQSLLRNAK